MDAKQRDNEGLTQDSSSIYMERIYWPLEQVNSDASRKIMITAPRSNFPVDDRCRCSHHIVLLWLPSLLGVVSAPSDSEITREGIANHQLGYCNQSDQARRVAPGVLKRG